MNTFQAKDYGKWDVWHKAYSTRELLERRAKLAKVANARLLRLERSKSHISGRSLIEGVQFDYILEHLDARGRKRFSEAKGRGKWDDYALKSEITLLENFLAMQSSTVQGIRKVEQARVNKLVERGVPEQLATNPDFYRFLNSATYEWLERTTLTSEDIVDEFAAAYAEGASIEDIVAAFEEFSKNTKKGRKGLKALLDALDE